MASTYWMSASGTDTNNATNYTDAVKTIGGVLATTTLVLNDTIYVVNDGTYTMTNIAPIINNVTGVTITGATSNGTPTVATFAATGTTNKLVVKINDNCTSTVLAGLKFDYTALRQTGTTAMRPVDLEGQVNNCQLLDCEVWYTETLGATVTGSGAPEFPYLSGAGSGSGAVELEIARCVLVGARMVGPTLNSGPTNLNYHNNIIVHDGDGMPSSATLMTYNSGSPAGTRRFYKNTLVVRAYDTDLSYRVINSVSDDTTHLYVHSNLIYAECGSNVVAAGQSANLLDGAVGSTQTDTTTMGYDLIALGPDLSAFRSTWTGTTPGIASYQYLEAWRGGGSNNGSVVPDSLSSLVTNQTLQAVFTATTASWTWTPDVYSHDLPFNLQPLQGLTLAFDGQYAGAVAPAAPIAVADTYSTTAGATLTTTAGNGVLVNDTDPNSLTLTASLVVNVGTGTLNLSSDGGFTYVTDPTYVGTVTFEYKAKNSINLLSNQTTCSISCAEQAVIPPSGGGGGIVYEGVIDSLPFYRPVFKADTAAMLQVRRNENFKHSDVRHYLRDEVHDESTSRVVEVPASSGRVAVTLGGVAETQGVIVESDQTVAVSFIYNNGTTNVTFTATVDGVFYADQVALNNIVVNNTSSTTATVQVAVFD